MIIVTTDKDVKGDSTNYGLRSESTDLSEE